MAVTNRGGVEDTRLEAKDTKKIRGQGQEQSFRGQTLSRPRTGMLEAKAKDQGHKRKCSPKKSLHKKFLGDLQKKKKVFTKIFQAISTKKRFPKNFSSASQNFNNSKNSAVLEPRTGQFSRTWGLEAKAKDFKMCPRGLHLWWPKETKKSPPENEYILAGMLVNFNHNKKDREPDSISVRGQDEIAWRAKPGRRTVGCLSLS